MKTIITILFIISSVLFVSCKKDDSGNIKGPVSKEQAIKLCKEYIDASDVAVILDEIMPPNTDLSFDELLQFHSPNYSAWVIIVTPNVYVDTIQANCVIFVNIETGELEIVKDIAFKFDKYNYTVLKNYKTSSESQCIIQNKKNNNSLSTKSVSSSGNSYAILISGGEDQYNNYVRYYNNCSFFYNKLVEVYGLSKSSIRVLFANGSDNTNNMNYGTAQSPLLGNYPLDFDGDGINDIDYSATTNNIQFVINNFSQSLQSGDNLIIFVTDHGIRINNQSYICLWGDWLSASYFYQILSVIPQEVNVRIVFGQCFSGGFISNSLVNRTVIATSCSAYEKAKASSDYSTFLKEFTSALAEQSPTGSPVPSDVDGFYGVSFKEAYDWAYDRRPEGNTPQYSSSPSNFGDTYNIIGEDVVPPVLSGPDYMLYPSSGSFMVTGRHSDDSAVSWTCTGYQHAVSTSDSTATMPSNYSTIPYNRLQITANITTFRGLKSLSKWFTIWRGGTFNYVYNLSSNTGQCVIQDDGHSFTLLNHNTEMTGYTWYTDSDAIEIDFDGYYFADYSIVDEISYPFSVTCSYYNSHGQLVNIVQTYNN